MSTKDMMYFGGCFLGVWYSYFMSKNN